MYVAQKFDQLIGLEGFSEKLLRNHFTLYEGYVTNVNKVTDAINELIKEDKVATPQYAELTRRLGWEFNGMRMHELYFDNMMKGGSAIETDSELGRKIVQEFGSIEDWEKNFKATGAMRGIGWVVLYYDPLADKLFNVWINEHDGGHFTTCTPLIVMDVFEHAYMSDYELKKVDYIESFMKALCVHVANARYSAAKA